MGFAERALAAAGAAVVSAVLVNPLDVAKVRTGVCPVLSGATASLDGCVGERERLSLRTWNVYGWMDGCLRDPVNPVLILRCRRGCKRRLLELSTIP
jgi:hypothetical protein